MHDILKTWGGAFVVWAPQQNVQQSEILIYLPSLLLTPSLNVLLPGPLGTNQGRKGARSQWSR